VPGAGRRRAGAGCGVWCRRSRRGDIYTVAGDGTAGYAGDGPATGAWLDQPGGVAVEGNGNLVIADTGNGRIRVMTG